MRASSDGREPCIAEQIALIESGQLDESAIAFISYLHAVRAAAHDAGDWIVAWLDRVSWVDDLFYSDAFLPLYRVRLLHRVVEISCLEDDWRAVAAGPMEDVIAGAGLPHFDLALAEAHVRAESDLAFRRVLEAAASGVWH